MNRLLTRRRNRKREKGAAMVETLLAYFVLFLVLLGMLHVFYFFAGQFHADYAAFRGARSRAVGFADYLVKRETRIHAIGASGKLISPLLHSSGTGNSQYDADAFTMEKTLIQRFMVGASWLEYAYWTQLNIRVQDSGQTAKARVRFSDYSFPLSASGILKDQYGNIIPDQDGNPQKRTIRLFLDRVDLEGSASLGNHSKVYLED